MVTDEGSFDAPHRRRQKEEEEERKERRREDKMAANFVAYSPLCIHMDSRFFTIVSVLIDVRTLILMLGVLSFPTQRTNTALHYWKRW